MASFTCPRCGKTSHNPNDAKHRYCGNCHKFNDMLPWIGQYILDDNDNPVPCHDLFEWGRFLQNTERRRVAYDELEHGHVVSTVFLGLDHNHFGGGPPVLWETMTFNDYGTLDCERYSSHEEALEGHTAAVVELKLKLNSEVPQ